MKLGSKIKQKILNFASFEAKKFSPRFASKRKLLNWSEAKNLKQKKQKKAKKSKKSEKKQKKQKNRLEFRFASFCFEAKITKAKRSEKFEAKISEKKRKKRGEIL
jgi:hypothetical protein